MITSKNTNHIWAVLCLLLATTACNPDQQNYTISKAAAGQSLLATAPSTGVTFIYQYNQQQSKLQWSAVRVEHPSEQPIQDAVSALLAHYQQTGLCNGLELKQIERTNNQHVIHLTGQPITNSPQDSTVFWAALDLTISRYTNANNYSININ